MIKLYTDTGLSFQPFYGSAEWINHDCPKVYAADGSPIIEVNYFHGIEIASPDVLEYFNLCLIDIETFILQSIKRSTKKYGFECKILKRQLNEAIERYRKSY
jgi:hypothetical protein